MITLYQIPRGMGLPVSASPYCAKLELYLRLTKRPYESVNGNPLQSPTKTMPFVKWPDGTKQGDSGHIIDRLEAEGPALNAGLSSDEIAHGRALEAEAQGPVYFSGLYTLFVTDEGWAQQKPGVVAGLPFLLRPFVPGIIRRAQIKKCAQNGFPDDRGYEGTLRALDVLSEALGDKPFFFGDTPRTFDCSIWGPLLLTAYMTIDCPPSRRLRGDAKLLAFVERAAKAAGFTLPPLP